MISGDIYHNKCSLDLAARITKKTRRGSEGTTWTLSRKCSSSGFGEGLAWCMWVVPCLLVLLGEMEGVTGVPIPNCEYGGPNDRDCGIRKAVDTYIGSGGNCRTTCGGNGVYYGTIDRWDTSLVTDMSNLFRGKVTQMSNANITAWDVSKVTTMQNSKFTPLIFSFSSSFSHFIAFFFFFFHFFGWVNHTCIYSCSVFGGHCVQFGPFKVEHCCGDILAGQYVQLLLRCFMFIFSPTSLFRPIFSFSTHFFLKNY
jgi:hypothetical protein